MGVRYQGGVIQHGMVDARALGARNELHAGSCGERTVVGSTAIARVGLRQEANLE